jgi:hypothetical protein
MKPIYSAFLADEKGKVALNTSSTTGEGTTPDSAAANLYSKLAVLPVNVVILDPQTYSTWEFTNDLPF